MNRLIFTFFCASAVFAYPADLKLWSESPAKNWSDGYPIGNGTLGAVIAGRPHKEIIQFNNDTLWSGVPHDYARPGASKHLTALRKYLLEGYAKAADERAQKHFMGNPIKQMSFLPLGELHLDLKHNGKFSNYRRELDLDSATVTVRYIINKTIYTREIFASYPDKCVVVRLTANKKKSINLTASLKSPQKLCNLMRTENRELSLHGIVERGATEFEARLAFRTEGGSFLLSDSELEITDADSVTLFLTAATSFQSFTNLGADPLQTCTDRITKVIDKNIQIIRNAHLSDHRVLFRRVELSLGPDRFSDVPTDERIRNYSKHNDQHLAAIYYQFARYLLIAGSRPKSQPLTMQGIWNNNMDAQWGSRHTTNVKLQMNYWAAETCNLTECTYPLLDMIVELSMTGQSTARQHYNCGGWVAHHSTDIWRAAAPANTSNQGIWVTGGAWLSQHLWEHYLFTGDKAFLDSTAYPIMKAAAKFFLDFLFKTPGSNKLISIPSSSPETGGLSIGPAIDHQIIRDLFSNCIYASKILDKDKAFRDKLAETGRKIPGNSVGKNGMIREWLDDKPSDPDHLYLSPCWGLYPGNEINKAASAEIYKAAVKWLDFKKPSKSGWSAAWMMCMRARLGDSEKAYDRLADILQQFTAPNLLQKSPAFHIDGVMGAAAGINEMLLQSHTGEIILLPALPKQWLNGSVTGLRARGGFTVNINWKKGRLDNAELLSHNGNKCRLRYGERFMDLNTEVGKSYQWLAK